jgi:SAM-dependent methyltransferase
MNESRLLKTTPDSEYNKLMLSEHALYYKNASIDFHSNYQTFDRNMEWKEPTTPRKVFDEIIERIPIDQNSTFLDCGCGLGHAVYLASLRFNMVYGVEYIAEIAKIAKQNLKKLLPNSNSYKIFSCDMFELDRKIIAKTNIFYISSPFLDESKFDKLIKIITDSLQNREREIWIIYFYPYCDYIMEKYNAIFSLADTLQTIGKVNYYHHRASNQPSHSQDNSAQAGLSSCFSPKGV